MPEKLTEREWRFMNEIFLHIHSNNDMDQMRLEFFDLLQNLVEFDYASFYLYKNGKTVQPVGYNLAAEELEYYMEKVEDIDPFLPLRKLLSDPNHPAIKVRDYVFTKNIEETEYYRRIWIPKKIQYSIFAGLGYREKTLGSLSLYRTQAGTEFSEKELQIVNTLKGHLNIRLWNMREHHSFRPSGGSLKSKFRLTDREIDVVSLWSQGLTDQEICQELSISKNTLKKHMANIFGKLEISSRVELLKVISSIAE